MKTKIEAAKICQISGCYMAIANGLIDRPIKNIIQIIIVHGLCQKSQNWMLEKNG